MGNIVCCEITVTCKILYDLWVAVASHKALVP
jgi:hypothetical protein